MSKDKLATIVVIKGDVGALQSNFEEVLSKLGVVIIKRENGFSVNLSEEKVWKAYARNMADFIGLYSDYILKVEEYDEEGVKFWYKLDKNGAEEVFCAD